MEPKEWQAWLRTGGQRALRDLVMREWDPIGISDVPEAAGEYDAYLGRIAERLRTTSSTEDIATLLDSFRTDDMGLRPDPEADERVAESLIGWYATAIAKADRLGASGMERPADQGLNSLPPLTRTDAWLLTALTEGSHDGRAVALSQFVHDADWLNRAIPTFDEMSFGLTRLLAHGLMTVDGRRFRATPQAIALRKSVKGETVGDILAGMADRVGARPYPEPEADDRSFGRLPSLEQPDLDAAVNDHSRRMTRWSMPIVATIRAAELMSRPLLAAKRGVRRVRARRRL